MKSLSLLVGVCLAVVARAQQFQNLDFEQGSTPPNYDVSNTNPTERQQILPGWISYYRNAEGVEDDLNHFHAYPLLARGNGVCVGSPCISVGSDFSLHGKLGLRIDAGGGRLGSEAGIRQAAQIPTQVKALIFKAIYWAQVTVGIDEFSFEPVMIDGDTKQVTYAVDVTQFAGSPHRISVATRNVGEIDYLRFSSTPVIPLTPILSLEQQADGSHQLTFTGMLQQATAVDGPWEGLWAGVSGKFMIRVSDPRWSGRFFRVRN